MQISAAFSALHTSQNNQVQMMSSQMALQSVCVLQEQIHLFSSNSFVVAFCQQKRLSRSKEDVN